MRSAQASEMAMKRAPLRKRPCVPTSELCTTDSVNWLRMVLPGKQKFSRYGSSVRIGCSLTKATPMREISMICVEDVFCP